jgi:hypothetical protein
MLILIYNDMMLEVDTMLDMDGDETDDPYLACVVIAQLPDGRWLRHEVSPDEFVSNTFH